MGGRQEPLSAVRLIALQFLVTRLVGLVGAAHPPQTRYAQRAKIATDAATAWAKLARDELGEDLDGVYHAADIERGTALGQRMLDRLEARDAS